VGVVNAAQLVVSTVDARLEVGNSVLVAGDAEDAFGLGAAE
jgi:hypothetical protein